MTDASDHGFRLATLADLACLRRWQRQPHVRPWWDDEDPYDDEDVADPRVNRWMVSVGERPLA